MKHEKNNIVQLMLFLAICILVTLYLAFNYNKIGFVQKFINESKQSNFNTHIVMKENNSIILDKYFSNNPIATMENQNVYFYDLDINKYDLSKGEISVEQNGSDLSNFNLYKYNGCTILNSINNSIHVFIPNNYVDKLSHMIPLFDKDTSIDSPPEESELVYQNDNFYTIEFNKNDGDYTEQKLNLNIPFEKDKIYVLRAEYSTTESGNPFFITIDDNLPGYYPIHQQLEPNTDKYKLANMMLIPDKNMISPSLLLRNSGGQGSVLFKNIRIYKLESEKIND